MEPENKIHGFFINLFEINATSNLALHEFVRLNEHVQPELFHHDEELYTYYLDLKMVLNQVEKSLANLHISSTNMENKLKEIFKIND